MCVTCGSGACGGCSNPLIPIGRKGDDGKSAYQIAVANGFVGTEQDWLASLPGDDGAPGSQWYVTSGAPSNSLGNNGDMAIDLSVAGQIVYWQRVNGAWQVAGGIFLPSGPAGQDGQDGANGTVWLFGTGAPSGAPVQSPAMYLNTLNGDVWSWNGSAWVLIDNLTGPPGVGTPGASAYQVAVANGFVGTEAQWLASLVGGAGPRGTRTGFGATDPNTMSQTGWQDGDVWYQTNIAGQVTYWQRVSGTWVIQYTLVASGGVVQQPYLFRATKTTTQPLPGTVTPTLITIEDDSTGSNFDASNSWNSFSQTLPSNVTNLVYKLENLVISRSGTPTQAITFTIDIIKRVSGVDTVLATVNQGTGLSASVGIAVLQTPPVNLNSGDQVRVRITPNIPMVDSFSLQPNCTFYNLD